MRTQKLQNKDNYSQISTLICNVYLLLRRQDKTRSHFFAYISLETAPDHFIMLKLNKLEKQTIRPAAEVYDVCAQLCSVAVQFEDAWERKDIEFDVDLEDAAYTQADPGLLELVWTNLLSNAVKFTPQGGSITLRQTRANGKLYVSVTDTGCGMDEKTIKHIYDKFYQGDTSHSTEGNGLGMALVKRILELTGAEIQIESTPGKGSTFTVVLAERK